MRCIPSTDRSSVSQRSSTQVAEEPRGLRHQVELVVRRDRRGVQRLSEAGHPIPVQLDPGADDDVVVRHAAAGVQHRRRGSGLDVHDGIPDPADAVRHHGCLRPHRHARACHAAGDVGEQRLEEVLLSWFDHDDVIDAAPTESTGDREPGIAAADDHDAVMGHAVSLPLAKPWTPFLPAATR